MSFDDVVRSALDTLPLHLAAALQNVAVVVEEENPEDPGAYGLFDGVLLTEGAWLPASYREPDRRHRRPLEEDFPDVDELHEEIRITVLPEPRSRIGLDEDRLSELGYE